MRASCNRFATVIAVATRAAALQGLIVAVFASLSQPADAADAPLVFQIRQGDLHGLIDRTGKVIVPPEFEQPLKLQDGLIMAQKGTKKASVQNASHALFLVSCPSSDSWSNVLLCWREEGTGRFDHIFRPMIQKILPLTQ